MKRLGLPDSYVEHGGRAQILNDLSLDNSGIKNMVKNLVTTIENFTE